MAKNYTFNEAVKIIAKGTDLEAITDIGRRYPVLAHKIAVVTAKAGEEFVDLMGYMPDYLTANKVNTAIKAGITESGSDEDAEDTEAEATTEDAGEDATEATAQWDESMSAKQLWDILGKAGKRKLAKSTKKADLVEACKQAFGAATEAEAEDAEAEDDEEIKIVRTKRFGMKPMYPEDACVQMELTGHDFFVFRNAETDEVNVVYKRKGNTFGLIEPEC